VIAGAFPRWGNRAAGSILRAQIAADTKIPTATSPRAAPRVGVTITGKSLSTRLTWSGADLGGSGVRRYELAMSRNGGSYATVSTGLLRPAANVVLVRGDSYRFRVRAVDFAGNKGAWTYGSTFSTALVQQTSSSVTFSRDWKTLKDARYSGGSTRVRSIRGAAARYRFTGRAVGLVSTLGATRGKARIYVDDHYVATIDLKASATTYRSVVWSKSWTSRGTHTVRVVVVGTSGRPRIDVDAFAVIR
jgi:hypothetical protein